MSLPPNKGDPYILRHHLRDHFMVGGGLVTLAIVAAVFVFLPLEQVVRRIALVVAATSVVAGIICVRSGLRFRRHNAWYLSFEPSRVRLNFFDYKSNGPGQSPGAEILDISREQLVWIRKTFKIRTGDDRDQFYVDMCVSGHVWAKAKQLAMQYQAQVDQLMVNDQVGGVEFFEGDILRCLLNETQWPDDLNAYWEYCEFPVADEYEFGAAIVNERVKNRRK